MSTPLKVGLVGTGRIANRHLAPYLQYPDRVRLTAACDVVEPAVRAYAKRAGVDDIYLDLDDMLRQADIDAVDICTRHDLHAPQTIAAARAGKHVLVEKAMGNSVQECRDMIDAADQAGVTLMVAQHLRYSRYATAAKRFIDEGNLGEIEAVRHQSTSGGNMRNDNTGHWMRDAKYAGGGMLMVTVVHHLDLLRYFVGNVKRVTAICRTLQSHRLNGAEDEVTAILEFENGAIGNVFTKGNALSPEPASYVLYGNRGSLASTPPEPTRKNAITQFGPNMVSLNTGEVLDLHNEDDLKKILQPSFETLPIDVADQPSDDYFVNEILHFEECCRTGREPISSGRDNIETIKLIMGIYESSRTGKAVDLDTL